MQIQNENQLQIFFKAIASSDFVIYEEVKGINLVENKGVRIDFICKAKNHVVEKGFTPKYFGVEVKHIEQNDKKKLRHALVQCITYSMSRFAIDNCVFRPAFVLLFSRNFQNMTELTMASYFNVGSFLISENQDYLEQHGIYNIKFASSVYYRQKTGIVNRNCALNRYCGTWT